MIWDDEVATITETTPKEVSETVKVFAAELGGGEPVFLPVRPIEMAQQNKCYENVKKQIRRHGGTTEHGWLIFVEGKGRWIQAIHHAVWRSPHGELVCVSSHRDNEKIIFFVPGGPPDTGGVVPGRVKALVDNKRVKRHSELCNELQREFERIGKPEQRTQKARAAAKELQANLDAIRKEDNFRPMTDQKNRTCDSGERPSKICESERSDSMTSVVFRRKNGVVLLGALVPPQQKLAAFLC